MKCVSISQFSTAVYSADQLAFLVRLGLPRTTPASGKPTNVPLSQACSWGLRRGVCTDMKIC